MRRGELLGLRWRDVDLDRAELLVRQQWSRQHGELRFGPPKTRAGLRTIDLDAGTVAVLRRHREAQELRRRGWGGRRPTRPWPEAAGPNQRPPDPVAPSHINVSEVGKTAITRVIEDKTKSRPVALQSIRQIPGAG